MFDKEAANAVWFLMKWMTRHRDDLIALARGRHVSGHYLYRNANFLEYSDDRLIAEAAEELADAVVYISRLLHNYKSK